MLALVIKEYYVMSKQLKIILLLSLMFAFIGNELFPLMALILAAMLPVTGLYYDEVSKWNKYAGVLPYSKSDIVLSKYLISYLCIIVAGILLAIGQLIISDNFDYMLLLLEVSVALVMGAVIMPIMLKFGTEKGRIAMFIILFAPTALGFIAMRGNAEQIIFTLYENTFAVLGASVLINIVSILISCKIKLK